ncbi:MAG: hypothetical protein QOF58_2982 [Pseudonocardiales bacterium]|jgi:hypothetical protein|nr:hypothetical protein [Pseudonocardiales bacterium]
MSEIPDPAIKAAFERYMKTPDEDDDGITYSTVRLMLRDALPHLAVIEVEAPGPDVPIRRRAERAIVRGLKYIGGFGGQVQVGREDGSFTLIAFDDTANTDPKCEVTVYTREGHHRPVCLDDVLARLREHEGEFRHAEHVVNYLEKERREGRL